MTVWGINPILCKHVFFLQFFEINEVSNAEWVAQKLAFVQQPDSSSSQDFNTSYFICVIYSNFKAFLELFFLLLKAKE
jgi:hypothetical protein